MFKIQRQYHSANLNARQTAYENKPVPGVWEDVTAGGDTPEKAIDALVRAGAVGVYRILVPDLNARECIIRTVDFEIVEEKVCRAITPDSMQQYGRPSDSGSQ